jgi:hypothetical protein
MPRVSPAISNFTAGEYSPQMFGQIDLASYPNACRLMRNFICRVHGGAQKRPGTIFVGEVKYSAKDTRIIPFQYSTTQTYVLEIGDSYMRVYVDGGQVLNDDGVVYEAGVPYVENDLELLRYVQDKDLMYFFLRSKPIQKLIRYDHDDWECSTAPIINGPYLSQNNDVEVGSNLVSNYDMELDSGWTSVGSPTIQQRSAEHAYTGNYSRKVTSSDGLSGMRSESFPTTNGYDYRVRFRVFTSEGSLTLKIKEGSDSGTLNTLDTITSIPLDEWTEYERWFKETAGGATAYVAFLGKAIYIDNVEIYRVDTITITPSAVTGNWITLTANQPLFVAGHVGAFFKLTHGEAVGHVIIRSVQSDTVALADVVSELGDDSATASFAEGAWSPKNGYPSCGAFYEQRLIVASSENDEDAVWGSKPTEYENFTPGVLAADPIGYKLQSDIIRWLAPMGQLVVGTVNSEYRLGSQNSSDAVTPTNVKLTQQSRKGSSDLDPVNVGNAILFVQRRGNAGNYGTKLRELSYNYVNDSYDGIDLSLFAEHITGQGLKRIAFMSSPYPIVWGATADGKLVGMTYEREQKVIGWHYHPMDGLVNDLCVVPGDNQDDLYLIVERTIAGVTKQYIEVMADFDYGTDLEDAYFVDCGLSYNGAPTITITGLNHLEGETVAVLADGIVQTSKTVNNGTIALDTAASVVHVGLPYISELEPLDLQGGSLEGTSQGKIKRIHGVALYLYNSVGGEIGQDEDTTERLFYKEETDGEGEKLDPFTGIKDDFNFSGDWQLEGRVYIKHEDPLPFTVLSILPRFRTEDR